MLLEYFSKVINSACLHFLFRVICCSIINWLYLMDKADLRCSLVLCVANCMASTTFNLSYYWTKSRTVSWISIATALQGHLICLLLYSNYFMLLVLSEQMNSACKLWLFLSEYFLQWTVSSLCSPLSHQQNMPTLDGTKRKVFFLSLQNDSVLALLGWERWWFLYTTLFELLYFHSLSLFLTYFVHCLFKPWLIWSSIADAQCICNVVIRSHLEDVPVTTNTFAFQSRWLQARSLGPHPHPSTLRNPRIPESPTFTCVWCYILQETGRDACL